MDSNFFFYHTYWDVVGIKVWEMIVHSFHSTTINPALVETLIVPIPKVDNPMSLKDFRPIGLCNVILKAISKILVIRIRPYLNFLIGPL